MLQYLTCRLSNQVDLEENNKVIRCNNQTYLIIWYPNMWLNLNEEDMKLAWDLHIHIILEKQRYLFDIGKST